MILRLDNTQASIAQSLYRLWQKSYAIEAELLDASDFPPLKRLSDSFMESDNVFYGYYKEETLASVIEVRATNDFVHIQSLVVDPAFFRQGIGLKLVRYVLQYWSSDLYVVETGLKNVPAVTLYEKCGFKVVSEWDTDHGVRKVKMELRINN